MCGMLALFPNFLVDLQPPTSLSIDVLTHALVKVFHNAVIEAVEVELRNGWELHVLQGVFRCPETLSNIQKSKQSFRNSIPDTVPHFWTGCIETLG